jgi:hypothetical protein
MEVASERPGGGNRNSSVASTISSVVSASGTCRQVQALGR